MRHAVFTQWSLRRNETLQANIRAADRNGGFSLATRGLRLFLQSAMLGLGAFLVLEHQITGGAMIEASILLGPALAPVEQLISQWPVLQRFRQGWANLETLPSAVPIPRSMRVLPKPKAALLAQSVTIVPPGESSAALRMLSFSIQPGQAVGVIGPSGAGKSTLAKAVTGLWLPAGGKIRLDGAALDQFNQDTLGGYIGYLPQSIRLLPGTIRQNINRFDDAAEDSSIVTAAQKVGAHKMILMAIIQC